MWAYLRLSVWCLFWAFMWPIASLWKRAGQENCLTWAFRRWQERPDGYIVIRWSRSNKYEWMRWPHFLFIDPGNDDHMIHLLPKDANDIDKHMVPAMWFDGEVIERDNVKQGYEN